MRRSGKLGNVFFNGVVKLNMAQHFEHNFASVVFNAGTFLAVIGALKDHSKVRLTMEEFSLLFEKYWKDDEEWAPSFLTVSGVKI